MHSFLGQTLLIESLDNRCFRGQFVSLDWFGNILLRHTECINGTMQRYIGMLMIPRSQCLSIKHYQEIIY